MSDNTTYRSPASTGTIVDLGNDSQMTLKVVGADTGGTFALLEYIAGPGSGFGLHTHKREDVTFYILEGTMTFQHSDHIFTAEPEMAVRIPKNTRHAFANQTDRYVKMLIIVTPAGLEQFFVDVGLLAADYAPEPPSSEAIAALAERYELDFASQESR